MIIHDELNEIEKFISNYKAGKLTAQSIQTLINLYSLEIKQIDKGDKVKIEFYWNNRIKYFKENKSRIQKIINELLCILTKDKELKIVDVEITKKMKKIYFLTEKEI